MFLGCSYKLIGVFYVILILKVVYALPVEDKELQSNQKGLDAQFPAFFDKVEAQQSKPQISRQAVKNEPNVILNEMFDNITEHFIPYSRYLESAPTTELMELRVKALKDYTDAKEYTGAVSKFDKFVQDFRPDSRAFDKFAFSTVDFLLFPGLSTKNYTPSELKRIRANVVNTIPEYVTEAQRKEFIRVVDSIFAL